jgi:hypothetical protein
VSRPRPLTLAAVIGTCLLATVGTGVAGVITAGPAARPAPPAAEAGAAPGAAAGAAAGADDATAAAIPPLRRLTAPDAVAVAPRAPSRRDLARLERMPGVRAVTTLDRGHVRIAGRVLSAVGVDPGEVRGFTPSITAASDALWQSVARGELTVSYAAADGLRRRLGGTLPVRVGREQVDLRVGALAAVGLGRAEVVVDHSVAGRLGFAPARKVLVSAPRLSADRLSTVIEKALGHRVDVRSARPQTPAAAVNDYARATIPTDYLARYRAAAATCAGLPWTVLAGIGAVETWHGSNVHRSSKGAVGPMQFLPSTFAAYGIDGDGDGVADVHDPDDAVYSAARYLCLWGAGRGGQALYDAVWAYNHADWYVRRVFAFANAYA